MIFVLNLVISGIPSIPKVEATFTHIYEVLNLVISGIPSIHNHYYIIYAFLYSFKPCYKWNTFNTLGGFAHWAYLQMEVLNLVISGIPSIQKRL